MIISTAILLLILLPIILSVVLSVPSVQNRIVSHVASWASDYLGAEVRIGRIDVTMRGGVEVSEFLARDLQADTLIYIERVESSISIFTPISRNIRLGHSSVTGAELHLKAREMEDGSSEMNIRQIALLLAGKGRSPMEISIESVVVEGMNVTIEQLSHNNPEYGVDMRNIGIRDLSCAVSELSVSGSAVHAYVERLSCLEQSGFELNNISGEMYLTDGAISISDMMFDSRWSSLKIDHLMLVAASWRDYRDFVTSTYIDINVSDGTLSSDDLAYFAPSVRDWGVSLYDMDLAARGEVDDLLLVVNNLSYGESTSISLDLSMTGLPRIEDVKADVKTFDICTDALDLDQLTWSLSGGGLSEAMLSSVEAMGNISLQGSASGALNDMDVDVVLESDLGEATTTMHIISHERLALDGRLKIEDFDIGSLLDRQELGRATISTEIDGVVDGGQSEGTLRSYVASLELPKYTLNDLYLASTFADGGVQYFEVVSRDKRLDLDIKGRLPALLNYRSGASFNFDINLNDVDLKALDINRRDTISRIKARITAVGGGSDLEQCWGRVDLLDGEYRYNSDTLSTSGAMVEINSEEGARSIDFKSEFGELHFASSSRVSHILEFLRGALVSYLPSLYDDPEGFQELVAEEYTSKSTGRSSLSVVTYSADPLMNAINPGLRLGDGANISFSFDPYGREIDASISTPYLERGNTVALDLKANAKGRGDSLVMRGGVGELFMGTSFIESARVDAFARGDRVDMDGGFVNPLDSASVNFCAVVAVANSEQMGRSFDIEVLPSTLARRDAEWNISSPSIRIAREGIDINQFKIENNTQLMTVNGRASRRAEDRVMLKMHDFDLSIFSTLIKKLGYNIEGRTSGEAILSSALSGGRFDAEVELDSVSINTLAAPPMKLTTEWDSRSNRARLFLADRISQDTLIRGYYIPSEIKYYALLDVDSLQMGILDPPLNGVIHSTAGYADLSLALMGERRDAHLNGTVSIYDVETTVGYTNVRYRLPRATINVIDNLLQTEAAPMSHVEEGEFVNRGDLSLEVDLQHLSNISYRVQVSQRDMMVLNTTESDNDVFYGQLYASGVADIEGDRSGVKMNIAVQSADNSHFFMPLTSKSNISTVDFITFVQPTKIDTTDISSLKRQILTRKEREKGVGAMQIDLSLDVRPNVELQLVIDPTVGDIIKARGEGDLNLHIEPKANIFDIYGDYTITEGNYLFTLRNIVNKRFVIDPGSSMQWTGPADDPILDINAIYKLRTSLQPLMSDESTKSVPVNCVINLSDRLSQPDVSFAIEIPSSDVEQQAVLANLLNDQEAVSRQFFYLVLANSFISDSTTGGTSDLGVTTTAATGFELLTNQLSNWLSTSSYDVIIRYRPESELMGEEVDFGFSKGLINNRLLVELEGNYIIDNKQAVSEDASSFLGEAYITWLIDQAGALKLKGFTQTIDRFDENQGLQETGIGVYYRENFDNFKDLRDRVKARFKASDERKERREARKSQEDQGDIIRLSEEEERELQEMME